MSHVLDKALSRERYHYLRAVTRQKHEVRAAEAKRAKAERVEAERVEAERVEAERKRSETADTERAFDVESVTSPETPEALKPESE